MHRTNDSRALVLLAFVALGVTVLAGCRDRLDASPCDERGACERYAVCALAPDCLDGDVSIDADAGDIGGDVGDTGAADTDVGPDAADTGEDIVDAGGDVAPDTTPDANEDVTADADVSTDADVAPDADPDADPDVAPDADVIDGTCDDGEQNGDETDVDCGGRCDGCGFAEGCGSEDDCVEPYVCDSVTLSCSGPAVRDTDVDTYGTSATAAARMTLGAFRNYLVVGAPAVGADARAMLYADAGGMYFETEDLTTSGLTMLGSAVATTTEVAVVAADGWDAAGVMRESAGQVEVWVRAPMSGGWSKVDELTSPSPTATERFGAAVAASDNFVVIGATDPGGTSGRVFVYSIERGPGGIEVSRVQTISPEFDDAGTFGAALSLRGNVLAVGAPGADDGRGAVMVYTEVSDRFIPADDVLPTAGQRPADAVPNDASGTSVAVDPMGRVVFGIPGRSTVGIIQRNLGGSWGEAPTILSWPGEFAADPEVSLGTHVATVAGRIVSSRVEAGADSSALYVWGLDTDASEWLPAAQIPATAIRGGSEQYTGAVAVTGSRIVATYSDGLTSIGFVDFSMCPANTVGGFCEERCDDGVQGTWETDVDCGGEVCGDCEADEGCVEAADCEPGTRCNNSTTCTEIVRP